ncbi:MAG: type 4a pilus biogenesis protein PilO [PVC group bacterium]|nr:type 4a pilus biogenesis protein PilO [PVC group bacterium]
MDKAALEKNQYLIAGIILLFIILILYFVFVFLPLFTKVLYLSKEESNILSQLDNAAEIVSNKDELFEEVNNIKKSITYHEERLPAEANVAQLLEELIKMGKASKITFVSIEPKTIEEIHIGEDGEGSDYLQIPIALELKAGYHSLGKFINLVEQADRFMEVDTFDIRPDHSDVELHNINLMIRSYALKKNKTLFEEKDQNEENI